MDLVLLESVDRDTIVASAPVMRHRRIPVIAVGAPAEDQL
jgi:hypothetical protein